MWNKIKNIISRKNSENQSGDNQEEDEYLGSITYYCKSSDENTYLDIQLSDFKEETLNKFAKIVSGLSSIRFQLETLQMIKGCFEETGDQDIFNEIVAKMIHYTEEEANVVEQINKDSRSKENQPWIKPSDMIK